MSELFKEELAQAMESWLTSRKNSSLQVLVERCRVPYPTLRRILQKETKATLQNTIQICSVIFEKPEGSKFVLRHFPDTGLLFADQEQNNITAITSEERIKLTREDFHTLTLAATDSGVSRSVALKKVGERAVNSIAKLIGLGIISENLQGILKANEESFRFIDVDIWLDELRHIVDLFDQSRLEQWGSLIHVKTESLTLEAKREAHKILTDAESKLSSLIRDKKNHGPYVMAYGIISTILSAPDQDEVQA